MCIRDSYTRSQNSDGGWGYRHGARSTGSMTAAGVASLYILGSSLYARPRVCGQYSYDRRIAAGLQWLAEHFSVEQNPGGGHHFYYLYALERAGMLSGLKYFGRHNWYREGAEYLLRAQRPAGYWGNGEVDTAFALLFLAKGKVPVLINKLKWRGDWNNDRHDAEHLCEFVSEQFGQRVGWQVVTLADGMEALRQAPILYFNGHGALNFTEEEKKAWVFADKLENSVALSMIIGIGGLIYIVYYFATKGFKLNLNIVNFTFLMVGILLHKRPIAYVRAIAEGTRGCAGIILQFPFYAGIMGMMKFSGLVGVIAGWFVAISNAATYPIFTYISAMIVNIFVPSGGGQWAVQGPVMVEAAKMLKFSIPKTVMAVAYGDQWTNLFQPFWALPLLGITGLRARDIMGYCMALMFLGIPLYIILLLIF